MQNSNELIVSMLQRRQFDSARYACIERIKEYRFDPQVWTFLGQSLIGLKRGKMAEHCFRRSLLLDPFATWESEMHKALQSVEQGRDDKQVQRVLEVPHEKVSACILTRDSSRTIRQCLEALRGAVDEIIVVDTGSTDDTISIVESFGIEVHHFDWIDDFAAARNYALSFVTSEWVISVDSDEILYPEDNVSIRTAAGMFDDSDILVKVLVMNENNNTVSPTFNTRMFKTNGFKWKYPIHETLVNEFDEDFLTTCTLKIRFFHDGYNPSVVNLKDKCERNIRILSKVVEKDPTNIQFLYYLGREHIGVDKNDEAIALLEKAYKIAIENIQNPSASILICDISVLLYKVHKLSVRHNDAKSVVYRLTQVMPEYPDGWFYYGIEVINSPSYDHQMAVDIFTRTKRLASTYRGPSNFDPEIGAWKTDSILKQLAEKNSISINQS